jgi:hypothetical protein
MSTRENAFYVERSTGSVSYKFDLIGLRPVAIGTIDFPVLQSDCGIAIGQYAGYWEQGECAIAIGKRAGNTFQGDYAVAIGMGAGQTNQQNEAVAIGLSAGNQEQQQGAVAIGIESGYTGQQELAVAVGANAGYNLQQQRAVAIGADAGNDGQQEGSVAIGSQAGQILQEAFAVAIGQQAGNVQQQQGTVAIGDGAGNFQQQQFAVAIGSSAGVSGQQEQAIAIGHFAGEENQGNYAVAIGYKTATANQGDYSIAIGHQAGFLQQVNESIILNASSTALNCTQSGTFVQPIRGPITTSNVLYYDTGSKEITYAPGGGGGGLPPGSSYSDYLYWNGSTWAVGSSTVHLGANAGLSGQSTGAIALGVNAGQTAQGTGAIALGVNAGSTGQKFQAIAIGANAGNTGQSTNAVAIGVNAGQSSQGQNSVAIGTDAGQSSQQGNAVAIGSGAGFEGQQGNAVAIGYVAGAIRQQGNAVAIGYGAGYQSQGLSTIAIGQNAGAESQKSRSIAIGDSAGNTGQSTNAIAIGYTAGNSRQGVEAISIGREAGFRDQQTQAIAIGYQAGSSKQGAQAIAIGTNAASFTQQEGAISLGYFAGRAVQSDPFTFQEIGQGSYAIAIGFQAGGAGGGGQAQYTDCIAIGRNAGIFQTLYPYVDPLPYVGSIAIGAQPNPGNTPQYDGSIVIGSNSASGGLTPYSIIIGSNTNPQISSDEPLQRLIILNACGADFDFSTVGGTYGFYATPIRTNTGLLPQTSDTLALTPGVLRYSVTTYSGAYAQYEIIQDTTNNLVPPSLYLNTSKNVVNLRFSLSSSSPTNGDLTIENSSNLYLHKWNSELPEIALYDPTTSKWVVRQGTSAVMTFDLATIGATLPNTTYDLYAFWNSSLNVLQIVAVTNLIIFPLKTQDGIYVRGDSSPDDPRYRYIGMLHTTNAGQSSMYNAMNQPYDGATLKSSKCFAVNYYNPVELAFTYWFRYVGSGTSPFWRNSTGFQRPELVTDVNGFNTNDERGVIDFLQASPNPSATSVQYDMYSNETSNTSLTDYDPVYVYFFMNGIDDGNPPAGNAFPSGTKPEACLKNMCATGFAQFNWCASNTYSTISTPKAKRDRHRIMYAYQASTDTNRINEHAGHGILARLLT